MTRDAEVSTEGFDAGDRELPEPPLTIDDATKERLMLALAAIIEQTTPEDLAAYLDEGFPEDVCAVLERPGERDELAAHVDLLLVIQQTPAAA